KGPSEPPDPIQPNANPRPDWPFLWLFGLLSLSPPGLEDFLMLGFPIALFGGLLIVPFISNRGERAPSRRPAAVLWVIFPATILCVLTYQGATAHWSPHMEAWSGDPIPEKMVRGVPEKNVPGATPIELQGAAVFQLKTCRNCHALDGVGGRKGPDLTEVAI